MNMRNLKHIFIAMAFVLTSIAPKAEAENLLSHEYLVKAAFIYNFAKFIEWPPEAFENKQVPVTLGIIGQNPFGTALETIEDKTVRGRKMVIKRFAGINHLEKCHMLFIAGSEKNNLDQIFSSLNDWNVLTISDMQSFARQGGIINFITVKNKINFEINIDEAEKTGLKISSKLLGLAKIVENTKKEEK